MNTKKYWESPKVSEIKLDNEISILMTSPPGDPFKSASNDSHDNANTDPYA